MQFTERLKTPRLRLSGAAIPHLDRRDWVVLSLLVVFYGVGDTASTLAMLAAGGLETNPIVSKTLAKGGPALFIIAKILTLTLIGGFYAVYRTHSIYANRYPGVRYAPVTPAILMGAFATAINFGIVL